MSAIACCCFFCFVFCFGLCEREMFRLHHNAYAGGKKTTHLTSGKHTNELQTQTDCTWGSAGEVSEEQQTEHR